MIKHTVGDGKYTITFDDAGKLTATRYGCEWRDMCGDGMILAMLQEIDDLKNKIEQMEQDAAGADW